MGARKLHGIHCGGKHVFEMWPLVGGKFPEHVAGHFAGFAGTDAELESGKCVGAEVLDNGFNAVVAACGAFFPEAQCAEWQSDVVVDD